MMESWRIFLYPLGFLASLAFGARFILQWIKSEVRQKSIVTSSFWKLSLIGNILLFIHSFIQMQFHVCVIQVINGVISWRNLNLMKSKKRHFKTRFVVLLMVSILLATTIGFVFQQNDLEVSSWVRIPQNTWNSEIDSVNTIWHVFGFLGLVLFNSRFWIQWWHAEKTQVSSIGKSFWWISLAGSFCALAYFIRIHDMVNIVGPAIGIVPYIRNLMLLAKSNAEETAAEQA